MTPAQVLIWAAQQPFADYIETPNDKLYRLTAEIGEGKHEVFKAQDQARTVHGEV